MPSKMEISDRLRQIASAPDCPRDIAQKLFQLADACRQQAFSGNRKQPQEGGSTDQKNRWLRQRR